MHADSPLLQARGSRGQVFLWRHDDDLVGFREILYVSRNKELCSAAQRAVILNGILEYIRHDRPYFSSNASSINSRSDLFFGAFLSRPETLRVRGPTGGRFSFALVTARAKRSNIADTLVPCSLARRLMSFTVCFST